MERPHPHLVALGSEESAPAAADAAPEPTRPWGRAALVLALLLVLAVAGLLAQSWRASRLESQVAGLEAQLGSAQAEIEAHEAHLDRVRDAVGAVRLEVMALEALATQEP